METWQEIWVYNIATAVASLDTNYVGGGYLGLLDNQLINLGGVSAADGLVPYRISWSAPGEYGVFQPYDVGSGTGNYAAGFNDLPSTSDILTGIMTIGTVAYLFRSQGITQMNPTGNGIEPFQFNHLWASELGIGTVLPDSIAQYGATGGFIADSGIYTLGLSGLQEISGPAKELIFGLINNIPTFATQAFISKGAVTARCYPYLLTHPSVYYVVGILKSITDPVMGYTSTASTYTFYAIDINGGNSCYSLGDLPVASSPTNGAVSAVGKLSFVNRAYTTAPVPQPPTPPPPPIVNVISTLVATAPSIAYNTMQYEINGTQLRTTGSVYNSVVTDYIIATDFGFMIPSTATLLGIEAITNWLGQNTASGSITAVSLYLAGAQIGTVKTPTVPNNSFATDSTFGSPTDLWGAGLTYANLNDPTFGIGFQVTTSATGNTRSFFNDFEVKIWYYPPGGVPTFVLVSLNVAQVVPLFVSINNGILATGQSTFNAVKLISPTTTAIGTFAFRKEQMQFGYVPTVTKIGFLAAVIDNTQAAAISCSIDGGATFNTAFPDITNFTPIVPGSPTDAMTTVFSDGVQSLERPQLVIKLTNCIVAEVWYQGTLADFALI
jgi:hypothetical protein